MNICDLKGNTANMESETGQADMPAKLQELQLIYKNEIKDFLIIWVSITWTY